MSRRTSFGDRGHAVVLLLPVVAIAAMLAVGAARAGEVISDRARAQAAADAAALAGVHGGAPAAARAARANGASLSRFAIVDGDVVVSVSVSSTVVGALSATARATDGP